MLMFFQSLVNFFTTLSFLKKATVQESLFIISNGEQRIFIFMMLTSRQAKKWFLIMNSSFQSFVGLWLQTKEKCSALEEGIKIMSAVTGCWNMTTISKNSRIEVLFFLEDQILLLFTQREV